MRFVRLAAAPALLFAAGVLWAEHLYKHPNLEGAWRLDVAASKLGENFHPQAGTLTIDKDPRHVIRIAENVQLENGAAAVEVEWKVDGRFHPVSGPGLGQVLARWEKDELVGDRRSGDGAEMERVRFDLQGPDTLIENVTMGSGEQRTLVWKR